MTGTTNDTMTGGREGLLTRDGGAIPLLGVKITGRLQGRAAELKVAQRYRNTENTPIEAVYLFPLPEEAAVCGLEVRTGDRVLRGEVEEREKAFERYDDAMSEGHGAVLLDQERPNVFQMSVGNLLPGQEAVVEVRMVYRADQAGTAVRLMIPNTVSPRYAPSEFTDEQRREFERTAPDYALAVPYGMTVEVEAEMASPIRSVESPSHQIKAEVDGRRGRITLSHGEVAMDRDFVLTVETAEPHRAAVFAGRAGGKDHLLLELFPKIAASGEKRSRNICFLLDCSGSMDGDSIEEARRAVELCLRTLQEGDRFQVALFGSTYRFLFRQPRKFSQRSLDEAVRKIRDIGADLGGTEILRPLQAAMKRYDGERVALVLLTDGQVANEERVLSLAKKHRRQVRIFSFGIGAGSSEFLVRGLARESGGKAEFIHPGELIEEKVLRQFNRIDTPAVEEVLIDWGGLKVEQAPAEVPPLFPGEALTVSARLKNGEEAPEGSVIHLMGKTGEGAVSWEAPVMRLDNGSAVPLLWAKERIRDLETGFGIPIGSRQQRGDGRKRRALVQLSKEYGLLSSETSFVAIEEREDGERVEVPAELRKVPVNLTAGWHGIRSASEPALRPRRMPADEVELHACTMRVNTLDVPTFMRKTGAKHLRNLATPSRPGKLKAFVDGDETSLWYLELLQEQQADGSFRPSEKFFEISGIDRDTFHSFLKNRLGLMENPELLLATALAVVLLNERASGDFDTWKKAAQKAEEWLQDRYACIDTGRLLHDVGRLL